MLWLTNLKNNALLLLGAVFGVLLLLFNVQREKNKRLEGEVEHKDDALAKQQEAAKVIVDNAAQQVETQQAINAAYKQAEERENAKSSKPKSRPTSGNFSGGVPDDTDY